jgi:hypothetical protein
VNPELDICVNKDAKIAKVANFFRMPFGLLGDTRAAFRVKVLCKCVYIPDLAFPLLESQKSA